MVQSLSRGATRTGCQFSSYGISSLASWATGSFHSQLLSEIHLRAVKERYSWEEGEEEGEGESQGIALCYTRAV